MGAASHLPHPRVHQHRTLAKLPGQTPSQQFDGLYEDGGLYEDMHGLHQVQGACTYTGLGPSRDHSIKKSSSIQK